MYNVFLNDIGHGERWSCEGEGHLTWMAQGNGLTWHLLTSRSLTTVHLRLSSKPTFPSRLTYEHWAVQCVVSPLCSKHWYLLQTFELLTERLLFKPEENPELDIEHALLAKMLGVTGKKFSDEMVAKSPDHDYHFDASGIHLWMHFFSFYPTPASEGVPLGNIHWCMPALGSSRLCFCCWFDVSRLAERSLFLCWLLKTNRIITVILWMFLVESENAHFYLSRLSLPNILCWHPTGFRTLAWHLFV